MRVVRAVHLLELLLMAARAVLGRDDDRDQLLLVFERVGVAFLCLVTVEAVDAGLAVLAVVPFHRQTGVLGQVAFDAFLAFRVTPVLADLTGRAGGQHGARCQYKPERHRMTQKPATGHGFWYGSS